ncbi:MAG: SDR family NAD(P)-dependent oxidoreductase [Wenzhouxiangellaceae bacterium]|nr:MAG: SDR family NAD(P)-dependent oxidoreductase [Wenzhouxiangellaceae bacterium]
MSKSTRPVWLVTGAAGALGAAMVKQLLESGRDCIALDRNARALDKLHDGLAGEVGCAPALLPFDLAGAGPDDYQNVAEQIGTSIGRLDVLVHNAADFVALRPLEHQPADEWFKLLQAGLTGPMLLTSALLPLLRESGQGRIVFVADRHCLERPANWGAYGVAQAGREWMSRALAAELGPRGPRVMDIDPGPFYSPLRAAAWPAIEPEGMPAAAQRAGKLIESIDQGVQ